MAKAADKETGEIKSAGLDDSEFQWETAHEEAADQVVFTSEGDRYTGRYLGSEVIEFENTKGEPQSFTQLRFRDNDGLKVINAGYELREAFAKIEPGTVCRITLMKFVDIGAQSDMKSYRVDTAKPHADNSGQ